MIKYTTAKAQNFYTEGFTVSEPAPMVLMVEPGKFHFVDVKKELVPKPILEEGMEWKEIKEYTTNNYDSFKFEIQPDDEFEVIYDVYLLDKGNQDGLNIHVDRTEIGANTICAYTGETPMIHCLMSFVVPPNATSLEGIDIEIRKIDLEEE